MRLSLAGCLFAVGLSGCAVERAAADASPVAARATLGIETVPPTERQASELGLPFHVRRQGRIVERVEERSPAARAGLHAGDALLAIDAIELYSQDDLDDVLWTSRPGATVSLRVKRPGDEGERTLEATLGSVPASPRPGIAWRHASLANLPRALEEARIAKRNVLVGLSGAET